MTRNIIFSFLLILLGFVFMELLRAAFSTGTPARADQKEFARTAGRYQMSCVQAREDDIRCVVLDTANGTIENVYRFEGDDQCEKMDKFHTFWCD